MTTAQTARRKATLPGAAHRSATTRHVPLHLALGSKQPPGNGSTPFPLLRLPASRGRDPILFPQPLPPAAKSP
jgi:hypothetical protein